MSEITGLIKSGKDKYNVFLDGSFFCTLNAETIIKAKLKTGNFITKEQIETAQAENEKLIAFDKSLKYIANLKTEKQVKDHLYSKGYTTKTVDYCISKLKEYKYINDEEFAKIYVRSYAQKKGKRLLEFELKSKGVKEEIIKNIFDNLAENDQVLINLAEKFLKNKPRDKKTIQKLFAHLFSKGFEFEEINKIIRKYFYNFNQFSEDLDNDN